MTVFVDTSAFIAYVTAEDANHEVARKTWAKLLEDGDRLVATNYIVVETCMVLQRRSGMSVARAFLQHLVPVVAIEFVDASLHASAVSAFVLSGRRGPSIVDCVSFAAMRKLGINAFFAFDPHFAEQGFADVVGRLES
jgi:predicted nucleic acid-binding protein